MSRPSFVTRFTRWARSLPVSPWVFYPALLGVWILYELIAYSIAGVFPSGTWTARDTCDTFSGAAIGVAVLCFYYYLDQEITETIDPSKEISGLSDPRFA